MRADTGGGDEAQPSGLDPRDECPVYASSAESCDLRRNQLLAALPEADRQRLWPQLEAVDLVAGQVLCEPGIPPTAVVFPITAIVSLLYLTQDGASSELAVVGNDGVVGMALFMGGQVTTSRAVVQSAGRGWRLRAAALQREIARAGPLLECLLSYTQALMGQVMQTAACNRHHSIDQQLCRRLLLGLDRSSTAEILLTHEALSGLLGVRREGVTAAAQRLRQAGLIGYRRGRVVVLDRARLEMRSCECYTSDKRQYQRLLPTPPPRPVALTT